MSRREKEGRGIECPLFLQHEFYAKNIQPVIKFDSIVVTALFTIREHCSEGRYILPMASLIIIQKHLSLAGSHWNVQVFPCFSNSKLICKQQVKLGTKNSY